MMARLRDPKDAILAKPEGDSIPQTASASSFFTIGTSRRWSGFKNPRIVRVSRTFGGKDRHSKVCTIRGLRDRRIRLSVPTAVQLYDLQERLGLSQPSKVIDWLLDATKLDIDELPPLHFPQFHDQHYSIGQLSNNCAPPSHHFASYLDANLTTLMNGQTGHVGSSRININDNSDARDADGDEDDDHHSLQAKLDKIKWNYNYNNYNYNKASVNNEEGHYQGEGNFVPSLMNGSTMASYGNFYHWDPSNLSLSTQFRSHGFLAPTSEESNQLNNGYPGESSSNCTQQLFCCPPSIPTTTASLFPHNDTSAAMSDVFHPSGSSCHVSNTNQQINKGT